MATIGDRIKERRDEIGVSVAAIAKAAGISRPSVYQWESGESKGLKPENLVAVARILRVTIEWLATGEGLKEDINEEERDLIAEYRSVTPVHRKAARRFLRAEPEQREMFVENILDKLFDEPAPDEIVGRTIQPAPKTVHEERRRYGGTRRETDDPITWPLRHGRRTTDQK